MPVANIGLHEDAAGDLTKRQFPEELQVCNHFERGVAIYLGSDRMSTIQLTKEDQVVLRDWLTKVIKEQE